MNRFREEVKVIPVVARVLAFILAIGGLGLYFTMTGVTFPRDEEGPVWPGFFMYLVGVFMTTMFFIWTLLIGYVYGDARRRGMRHVAWTLLAIFIPSSIGIILYFIMRDPLMRNCAKCGALVSSKHSFCPECGSALSSVCPQGRRAVEPGWSHCTSCGAGLKAA